MKRGAIFEIVGLIAITALLVLSCGGPKDPVVAKVGDRQITLGDFNIAYKAITVFNRPPLVTYEDAEAFLQTLINKEILVQEALERGLDENPLLQRARRNWMMEQAIRALYKQISEANMEISLAEVEDYYRRSRVQVRARHILVNTLPAAEDIRRTLDKGGDFAALARENSIDEASRAIGGDLGTLVHGQLQLPALERAVFNLEPGEISEPIQTNKGFHIVQVQEKIEPSMDDFEEQRHACAAELRNRKRNENWSTYLSELQSKLDIRFHDENVNDFNELLPTREEMEESKWYDEVDDAYRARVLAEYAAGTWTIGEFLDQYGPDAGGRLFQSEDADMIKRVSEAAIVNKSNLDEAERRGLTALDAVVRAVERKEQEQLLELLYQEIVENADVPEEEVRALYEERREELIMPDRAHLNIIAVQEKKQAEEAHAELRRGVPFEEVSRKYNQGALRELRGDMGFRQRTVTAPELVPYAFGKLKQGELTGVVPHRDGFFVARLVDFDPEHIMTFEEAESELRGPLLQVKRDEVFAEWIMAKREELGIEIFPEALNLIVEEEEVEEP